MASSVPRDEDHNESAQHAASDSTSPLSWFSATVGQAQDLGRSVAESTDTVLQSTRSYITEINTASSQYSESAQNIFKKMQIEYGRYEDMFFQKLKEGVQVASDHPGITCSVMGGAAILLMKRPRRLLFRYTIGRLQNEESLLTSSEKRVNGLRVQVDMLKNEGKKLQERTQFAEEELIRGQTKLKQVGSQIQNLASSIHKTETKAKGLMENLRELPGRDALRLRAEVASLAAEAEQKRVELAKKVSKIANYGIGV